MSSRSTVPIRIKIRDRDQLENIYGNQFDRDSERVSRAMEDIIKFKELERGLFGKKK